mmetsp:Transcript_24493/g.61258  ORF Transcript_24493/g.61258 Transcript_24493/m.61258 type:complete len:373 (-) Transcript_24493:544-1662(-)
MSTAPCEDCICFISSSPCRSTFCTSSTVGIAVDADDSSFCRVSAAAAAGAASGTSAAAGGVTLAGGDFPAAAGSASEGALAGTNLATEAGSAFSPNQRCLGFAFTGEFVGVSSAGFTFGGTLSGAFPAGSLAGISFGVTTVAEVDDPALASSPPEEALCFGSTGLGSTFGMAFGSTAFGSRTLGSMVPGATFGSILFGTAFGSACGSAFGSACVSASGVAAVVTGCWKAMDLPSFNLSKTSLRSNVYAALPSTLMRMSSSCTPLFCNSPGSTLMTFGGLPLTMLILHPPYKMISPSTSSVGSGSASFTMTMLDLIGTRPAGLATGVEGLTFGSTTTALGVITALAEAFLGSAPKLCCPGRRNLGTTTEGVWA